MKPTTPLYAVSKDDLINIVRETIREELANIYNDDIITRNEAADILDISLPTLNQWVKGGLIPAYKIGKCVRFKRHEIHQSLKPVDNA